MDINTAFADPAIEQEGVWLDYRDDARVKLARLSNSRFQKLHEARLKPYQRLINNGSFPSDRQTDILCGVMAETVLIDWSGFTAGGEELPYSKDAAKELLIARIDFRNEISVMAASEENFKRVQMEEDSGNSETPSSGN